MVSSRKREWTNRLELPRRRPLQIPSQRQQAFPLRQVSGWFWRHEVSGRYRPRKLFCLCSGRRHRFPYVAPHLRSRRLRIPTLARRSRVSRCPESRSLAKWHQRGRSLASALNARRSEAVDMVGNSPTALHYKRHCIDPTKLIRLSTHSAALLQSIWRFVTTDPLSRSTCSALSAKRRRKWGLS